MTFAQNFGGPSNPPQKNSKETIEKIPEKFQLPDHPANITSEKKLVENLEKKLARIQYLSTHLNSVENASALGSEWSQEQLLVTKKYFFEIIYRKIPNVIQLSRLPENESSPAINHYELWHANYPGNKISANNQQIIDYINRYHKDSLPSEV